MKSLLIAATLMSAPVLAQQATGPACPDGERQMVIVISKLTPTGTRAGYESAVKKHQAWNASKGLGDLIFARPVVEEGGKVSDTEFLSLWTKDPKASAAPAGPPDPLLLAFLAEYKANSEIKTEVAVCMPAGVTLSSN
jgi:hypothetical protein